MPQDFEVGQKVWCQDPIEDFLTYGKIYTVDALREEEGRIVIQDDTGREGWYKKERFEAV